MTIRCQSFRFLALGMLLAASSPVISATPKQAPVISEPLTLTGTLTVLIADDFVHRRSETLYEVETSPGHRVGLRFDGTPPANLHSGMKIRVSGQFDGKQLRVGGAPNALEITADPEASVTAPATPLAAAPLTVHKTLIILTNITDGTATNSQIDSTCDGISDVAADIMFGSVTAGQNVDGLYKESSFGKEGFGGAVYPGSALDVVRVTINELATLSTVCNYSAWADAADSAATTAGVNLANYQYRGYVLPPNIGCTWAGLGYVGCGSSCRMWQKAYGSPGQCGFKDAYAHELGHNLGFWHASTDTNNNGVIDDEYGDVSDFMGYSGSGYRQVNGPRKTQLGWVASGTIVNGSAGGTFTVSALESASPAFPRVVKITPASGLPYYLSYRIATGYDSALSTSYTGKTNIHRWAGPASGSNTIFITALADNQTFTDSANALTITQLSHDSQTATFRVAGLPSLSIADVAIAEGNSGTKTATFTVKLSKVSTSPVTYNIGTAASSATAGVDYVASNLVGQSIAAGVLSKTFVVTLNGDTTVEANETFSVIVSSVVGAAVSDGVAVGTILNDDGPTLSIADVSIAEGNSGTKLATFTVKLSKASASAVTYNIATANGSAAAGTDYVASSLSAQSIAAGVLSKTFVVTLNGDVTVEANETFKVTASSVVGATVFDGVALGTILNDDGPTLSIADVMIAEGNSGIKTATFTAKLSVASASAVTYNIATANGTAAAGTDYVASSLLGQSIAAGVTSKTFVVTINGDVTIEANETFKVTASSVVGATIFDGVAQGTIVNDDGSSVISQLAAGDDHTCAITSGGAVKCWGSNNNGQVGDNSTANRSIPVAVSGLSSGVIAIEAGGSHTCALTSGGAVKCWGDNYYGALGDNSTTDRWTPVAVSGLSSGVIAISAGVDHTCALTSGGAVKCWGSNWAGQLGDNSSTNRWTPVAVSGLGSGVIGIMAGGFHTCAVTSGGAAKCWGSNSSGQLGDNSTTDRWTPVSVSGLGSGVLAITAGDSHSCARTSVGAVKCWGSNWAGQLGDNSTTDRWTPVAVSGLSSGVTAVAAGVSHNCALISGGAVKCWGYNYYGELGDNSTTDRWTPVAVSGLSSGVSAVVGGYAHTCALISTGAVKCWGRNQTGQLGDGTITNRRTPVSVIGL